MPSHPDRVRRNYDPPLNPTWHFRISKGPSCSGFYEDGFMVEHLYDADGKLIETKKTPFHEWNRI